MSDGTHVAGGSAIVTWNVPRGASAKDWIVFAPANQPYTQATWPGGNIAPWVYTYGATQGSASVTLPTIPGAYQAIYYKDDGYTPLAQSAIITVTAMDVYPSDDIWQSHSSTVDPTQLPVGDQKYVLDGPKKGYVFSCDKRFFTFSQVYGSTVIGPWVHGSTWDATKKTYVHGNVMRKNAIFYTHPAGGNRYFDGNALPYGVPTGVFPTLTTDSAYLFDKNPSTINEQRISFSVPQNPVVAATPTCMGLDAGITLDGVQLSGPLDSSGRDEVAVEIQDLCGGVAQPGGIYHRHGPSNCMPHIREKNALVGYALDGFGIFSPYDAAGKELRTSDLDECHGITSPIEWDGKTVNMYHYVLTRDYPYSPSCFRGTPVKDNFPERPKPPQPDQPSQKRNVVVPVPDVVQPESVPVQEYPPTSMAKKNVANALSAIERALRAILAEFSK